MNWKRMRTGRRFLLAAGLTLVLTLGLVGSAAWAAETETYIIRTGDTLMRVAAAHETTMAKILALNPGLDANNLYVGRTIQVPVPPEPGTVAAQCPRIYTTRAGDTWNSIAAAHQVDAGVLALVNNKAQTQALAVGTELCIPVVPPAAGTGAAATQTPTPTTKPTTPAVATQTPTPVAVVAKPTAIPVTAQQLLQDFRDNEIRGDQLHKGQVKSVTGRIDDIRDRGRGYYIDLGYEGDDWDFCQVHCQLRDPEQAMELRTGQAVTVRGRIAGLGLFNIIDIEDCAVTSAVPSETARPTQTDPASDTVTARQLLQDFRDNEIRGDRLHKGQVKSVTGRIDDIRDQGRGYYIDLGHEGDDWDFGQVHCQLRDPEQAVELRTGQSVTVQGRIAGLGPFDIIDIEDCAVTSAEAVPPGTVRLVQADPASDRVTAQQLLQDFRDNEIRGDQLHKGQVKSVTGRIDDIRDRGSGYYIVLGYEGDDWDFGQVHCQLRDPEQAAELRTGQAVTVRGRIAGLGLFNIIDIEDCAVTSAVPSETARPTQTDPASDTVTARQLLQDFRDNEIRGDRLHKGQVKSVTGRIDDIRDQGRGYYIDLGHEGDDWDFGQVHCQLRDPEQAVELRTGQSVTVQGRIAGLGPFDIIDIEDCAVTSAEAVPPGTVRLVQADPASDRVTAQQLLQDFRDNEIRGDQLHKGQVKSVTGRIDDIRDRGSGYYIVLGYEGDDWDFGQVHCQLRDPEQAAELRTGQAVTVRGRIAGLGLFDIIDIEDCAVEN